MSVAVEGGGGGGGAEGVDVQLSLYNEDVSQNSIILGVAVPFAVASGV